MIEQLFGTDNFNIVPHLVALVAAYALAFPIGWNCEQEERSAGLRTSPLVAVATCGFIQAAELITITSPEAMTKIRRRFDNRHGLHRRGAIRRRESSVKGTATAASLWITGAIGVAVGLGSNDVALMLSIATIVTFWVRFAKPITNEHSGPNLTKSDLANVCFPPKSDIINHVRLLPLHAFLGGSAWVISAMQSAGAL